MKITSKRTGMGVLSMGQTLMVMVSVLLWCMISLVMWFVGAPMWLIVGLMCLISGGIAMVAAVFIFDHARFERSVVWVRYFIRAMRGKTIVHQLSMDIEAIREISPIVRVHDDGLVECTCNRYMAVFRYHPAGNRKEGIEELNRNVEKFVDSLTSDVWVSFHFSHAINTSTVVEDMFLEQMNRSGTSVASKKHLLGMYEHITSRSQTQTTTAFLMCVRFGEFKSADLAHRAMQSHMPGMLKTLHAVGVYANPLLTEDQVVCELKRFAVLEEI